MRSSGPGHAPAKPAGFALFGVDPFYPSIASMIAHGSSDPIGREVIPAIAG